MRVRCMARFCCGIAKISSHGIVMKLKFGFATSESSLQHQKHHCRRVSITIMVSIPWNMMSFTTIQLQRLLAKQTPNAKGLLRWPLPLMVATRFSFSEELLISRRLSSHGLWCFMCRVYRQSTRLTQKGTCQVHIYSLLKGR